MGGVKQRQLELESRNLNNIPNKSICSNHFEDKYITRFIRNNYKNGYCDYCEKDLKVISMEELLDFIMDSISVFYEDAANFMSYDSSQGGYLGETFTPNELIQELVELDATPFEVIEDIIDSIEDIAWADPNMYYDNIDDELKYEWNFFKNIIINKSRYLFYTNGTSNSKAYNILKEVGKLINNLKLISIFPKGTKVLRCRQHKIKNEITEFHQITSPPNEYSLYPNRFSPSGISMFYCAFDKETAIKETVSREDKSKKYVTIGEFETKDDFYVIDFTKLPKIESIFGIKNKNKYYLKLFIYSLVNDLTKKISKDGREHIDYVPTQVVTEYFRYPFNKNRKNKISGILYPSSQNKGEKSLVFFWDNKESELEVQLNSIKCERIK
ncbi:hypothetical protein AP75_13970 [Kaistella haifensis DSM 19056]|uniref:RES domain-containing protein n=1 Tax=Kaistella haifensis DSM 19056 TaxID=1450526 RepID=A0A246B6C3_9FLAO|nr:HEPN-associated N-terminal domain-containing protein [Kaistella haifensis]OWK96922.1 hypothetical protein AP75_13970 [Kaistella haifensis DSM 19056]